MNSIIQQASSFAGDIDNVILLVAVLGGFWLILAEVLFFYFIFKFRRTAKNNKAQYITGEKKEEKKWIKIPHNLVLVCDVLIIVFAVRVWYNVKQVQPPADETIRIVGHQWAWEFVHPAKGKHEPSGAGDIATIDELHVMVNKTYHFKLESSDVLHSFSVPVFRLKQDALPGRVITGWFKPTAVGTFDIQCTQMCGMGHGVMGARIHVESEEDYNKWIDEKSKQLTGTSSSAAGSVSSKS